MICYGFAVLLYAPVIELISRDMNVLLCISGGYEDGFGSVITIIFGLVHANETSLAHPQRNASLT